MTGIWLSDPALPAWEARPCFYRSPDLIHWTYLHLLHVGQMDEAAKGKGPVATGEMWECPEFISLGGKHVLIVSTEDTTRYFSGRYTDYKFHAEREGETDFGALRAQKHARRTGQAHLVGLDS